MKKFLVLLGLSLALTAQATQSSLIAAGDSLTRGYGLTTPSTENWVAQMALTSTKITNLGVDGTKIVDYSAATNVLAQLDTDYAAGYRKHIVTFWYGTNDIATNETVANVNAAVDTWITNVRAWAASHPSSSVKLLGLTTIPNLTTSSGPTLAARLVQVGDHIKVAGFDAVYDAGALPHAADDTNSTYYQADHVHGKTALYTEIAAGAKAVILANGWAGCDYYVRTDGNNSNTGTANTSGAAWLTLAKAASTMIAGDTVTVQPGTYAEVVTEATSGVAGSPIIYQTNGSVTLNSFVFTGSYISASGFTLLGAGSGAIMVGSVGSTTEGNYCTFTNLTITGANDLTDSWSGVYCCGSNCTFTGLTITNAHQVSVRICGDNSIFEDFTITNHNGYDIFHGAGDGNIIRRGVVHYNNSLGSSNHQDFAQAFNPSADTHARNNIVDRVAVYWDTDSAFDTQIGNFEDNQQDAAISGWIFRNCLFVDIPRTCNLAAPNFEWYNNTFVRCANTQTDVLTLISNAAGSATGTKVRNNIFYQCGSASSASQGWYDGDLAPSVSDHNLVVGTGAGTTKTGFTETGGVNGQNPLFVSTTDFSLQSGSPAKDAGATISGYTTDLLGATRSGTWDIGAYEYTGGEPPSTFSSRLGGQLALGGKLQIK